MEVTLDMITRHYLGKSAEQFQAEIKKESLSRRPNQLTLGQLIEKLKSIADNPKNLEIKVYFDFADLFPNTFTS